MTNANFDKAYHSTSIFEGGLSDDKQDRGGLTYCGISKIFWPNWPGWRIVEDYYHGEALQQANRMMGQNERLHQHVKLFYYDNFWLKNNCQKFHQEIANELFDTSVNQGIKTAAIYFQKTLNLLNRDQKDFPDLKVDGQIGKTTCNSYNIYMSTEGHASRNHKQLTKWLLQVMNYYQLDKYIKIANKSSIQEKFIPGWLNRA